MSKFKTGLLLLQHTKHQNVCSALRQIAPLVEKKLYVDFLPSYPYGINSPGRIDYFKLLLSVYSRPKDSTQMLDIQVLLPSNPDNPIFRHIDEPVDVLFVNEDSVSSVSQDLSKAVKNSILCSTELEMKIIRTVQNITELSSKNSDLDFTKTYEGVVIGGTFDRLHDGHKVLLQTALLLAEKKLTVGVADGPLLDKKILKELIEPVQERIKNVIQIIEETKPGFDHKVVPITDPCGPSGTDDDLQLLLVSEETLRGGSIVNNARIGNNLPELDVMKIDLVKDSPTDLSESLNEEGKISSSAGRVRELGTLLRKPNMPPEKGKCYVIGVTGGIASGKSSIVKRLGKMGAYTVDCDLLGHEAYIPGQPAYNRVVKEFGTEILKDDGTINRQKLGPIVFGDQQKLKLLNSIVWPEIHRMKTEIIDKVSSEGKYSVVIFEGAVLFEAGWEREANEVWCCVIPKDEAVKRIVNRNGLSEDAALKRISSQMSNEERVSKSHVVLSTLWEPDFTGKQCQKAWHLLEDRLKGYYEKNKSSL